MKRNYAKRFTAAFYSLVEENITSEFYPFDVDWAAVTTEIAKRRDGRAMQKSCRDTFRQHMRRTAMPFEKHEADILSNLIRAHRSITHIREHGLPWRTLAEIVFFSTSHAFTLRHNKLRRRRYQTQEQIEEALFDQWIGSLLNETCSACGGVIPHNDPDRVCTVCSA
jgi:hypothetical protein